MRIRQFKEEYTRTYLDLQGVVLKLGREATTKTVVAPTCNEHGAMKMNFGLARVGSKGVICQKFHSRLR